MNPRFLEQLSLFCRELGLQDGVLLGAAKASDIRALKGFLKRILVPLSRPETLQALAREFQDPPSPWLRLVQASPGRAVADWRRRIDPEACLFFFHGGQARHKKRLEALREALFYIPRGAGALLFYEPRGGENLLEALRDQCLRWSPGFQTRTLELDEARIHFLRPPEPVHVTFCIEKYSHGYQKSGLSINLDNLVHPLEQTGLAGISLVFYDQFHHERRPLRLEDLSPPQGVRKHMIVSTYHYHSPANPSIALLEAAKAQGSKIVYMWLDKKTSAPKPEYAQVSDINVILDGTDFGLPNSWPIFTPKNPAYFNDPGLERDLGLTLVGELRRLKQRQDLIAHLEAQRDLDLHIIKTSAVDPELMRTVPEYAQLFQRSKISIALTQDRVKQLKGRIFEIAHCGAMLLCDLNPYISSYFVPGKEFVPFRDFDDLVAKARYYLEHEEERAAIARAGHRKAVTYYNTRVFWESLFRRAGF
jgi:glycosyltransferase involved in cell wall biosynthesis